MKIPELRSWERNGSRYQLFCACLGYLRIKHAGDAWALTIARDLDGVHVGQPEPIGTAASAAGLVDRARTYVANCTSTPAAT